MLDKVQREPVTITKNGRPTALVVALASPEIVKAVQAVIEDHYWGKKAVEADAEGYLSQAASEKLLSDCLGA